MKLFKTLIFAFIFVSINLYSQQKDEIIFSIDNIPTNTDEFIKVYSKNLNVVADDSQKDIENYLEMYINYKLKIKQAYELKLDTAATYIKELNHYRKQLILPFLKDKNTSEKLVLEAYERTKFEIKASHILVQVKPKASPSDTLKAFTKIVEARNKVLNNIPFDVVAREMSEDPSVKDNGGDLGYFSAFQMVYPFESAAYNTKEGEVSQPFKTRFGYHLVKVNDIRESKGKIEVGHIMIKNSTKNSKNIIDSVYLKLTNGDVFEELAEKFSEDKPSAVNGGKLPIFSSGVMLPNFEEQSFLLKNENEFSKPFKTKFGWHIVKLYNKFPIETYDELKEELISKINKNERSYVSNKKLNDNLRVLLNNETLITKFDDLEKEKDTELQALKIENTTLNVSNYLEYLKKYNKTSSKKSFNEYKDNKLLEYYKNNLENFNDEFKSTMKEYKEGLLLFDLLQKNIWEKSEKDTLGLKTYFEKNKLKYSKEDSIKLEKIKGRVIGDYQTYLDSIWIDELRNKYSVSINKKVLKDLIKQYK